MKARAGKGKRKYFYEVGILAALLAGVLGLGYYSEFVSTGYSVASNQTLPSAVWWAADAWAIAESDEPLVYMTTDMVNYRYGKEFDRIDFKGTLTNATNNSIAVATKVDWTYRYGYLFDPVRQQWVLFEFKPTTYGEWDSSYTWIKNNENNNPRNPQTNLYANPVTNASNVSFYALSDQEIWIVAYTCETINGRNYCGCKDKDQRLSDKYRDNQDLYIAEKCRKWQAQNFRVVNTVDAFCGDGVCVQGENIRNACPKDCIKRIADNAGKLTISQPPVSEFGTKREVGIFYEGQILSTPRDSTTPIDVKNGATLNIICSAQTPGVTIAQGQHLSVLTWIAECSLDSCSGTLGWTYDKSGNRVNPDKKLYVYGDAMNFSHYGFLDATPVQGAYKTDGSGDWNDATTGTFTYQIKVDQPVGTGIAVGCQAVKVDGTKSGFYGRYLQGPLIKVVAPA